MRWLLLLAVVWIVLFVVGAALVAFGGGSS